MSEVKPLPAAELKAAEQKLCRQVAAAIASAMAMRNMGFAEMGVRIGRKEKTVRRWFRRLLDGSSKGVGLREVSDMVFALDCQISFDLRPREELPSER